jgi:predicted PhzF superfamily epimerase YddE/YHI9
MATYSFRIVNVFTHHRGALTGNPLCVFEDAADFDTRVMQALELQISQGEFVGRPSTLYLQVTAEREILVGGDVIELGKGAINIG